MNARRPISVALACLCALVAWSMLCVPRAAAAVTHNFLPELTATLAKAEPAPVGGPFGEIDSVSVDAGTLYVAEGAEASRIDTLNDSSGAFGLQFPPLSSPTYLHQGLAVGHSTGEAQVYLAGDESTEVGPRGVVGVFTSAGGLLGVWKGPEPASPPNGLFGCFQCTAPADIAVDANPSSLNDWAAGDVYVTDLENKTVDVFKPLAGGGEKLEGRLTGPEAGVLFSAPVAVAVNASTGEVLVADREPASKTSVDIFKPTLLGQYEFAGKLSGPPPSGTFGTVAAVSIDAGNGDIYVAESEVSTPAVYQFDAEGEYEGRLIGFPTGENGETIPFSSVASIAVDPSSHYVYVGDSKAKAVDAFGPDVVLPSVLTEGSSNLLPSGVTLHGKVNPDKAGTATCRFLYGATTELDQSAACSKPVGEGSTFVPVEASLTELRPDTKYHYRLQAVNGNGANPGEPWQDGEFVTPGPGLHGETVSAARAESVTFDGKLNPHGVPTSYYFQYGTTSAYGASAPALTEEAPHGAAIGAGEGDQEVSQHVQGLTAATNYHYRLAAISERAPGVFEAFYGPDQTFATQALGSPPQLPDGRSWEMVSPPQKQGALMGRIDGIDLLQASVDGNAFTDWATAPTEEKAAGLVPPVPIVFGRGSSGWTSKVIASPHFASGQLPIGQRQEYRFFSEDLSEALLQPGGMFVALSPEASESTPYLRTDYLNGAPSVFCSSNCYRPLVSAGNVPSGTEFGEEPNRECLKYNCGPLLEGANYDLTSIVLSSPAALTSTPTEGNESLYEWSEGKLSLVSLLPEGESNEAGAPVALKSGLGASGKFARNAISRNGSRVVWEGNNKNGFGAHLYLRDTAIGVTTRLDVFQGVEKGPESNPVEYMTASSDDSRIFFLDAERLTTGSTASNGEADLYEYNLNAPTGSRLTDLSIDTRSHESAAVSAVLGAGEDGSYVYFAAGGALAPGARPGHCGNSTVPPGDTELCNLYVRHNGATTLIAALSAEDFPDWGGAGGGRFAQMPARVSPSGRWLAFMSNRNLTEYDATDALTRRPDEEVYLYDGDAGKLVCASCNPTGARPVGVGYYSNTQMVAGGAGFTVGTGIASSIPSWSEIRYQSRYLSDSGRLFFDSHDSLVPQDVNGTQDVYQYEPGGIGGCDSSKVTFVERAGGCVDLISSGTSNEESAFLDASATGDDVFFLTASQLAPQDFDAEQDVYDAHVCSASAPCLAQAPVSPPPCDTGEGCKPAQTPQPTIFGAGPSETFSGSGDLAPPRSTGASHKSIRAQKLARALQACRKEKRRKRRAVCVQRAKKLYALEQPRKANATKRGNR